MAKTSYGTVLIVEDELFIRLETADALADAGFEVLEADNADEALAMMEGAGDIRLIFTDINMPGTLDGLDLARVVHERWPEVRLLVTSGHMRVTDDQLPDDGRFLSKPYRTDRLVDEIRALIGPR